MHHRIHMKNDGRELHLYSWGDLPSGAVDEPSSDVQPGTKASSGSHMRWHPLRNEWVSYSTSRQNRTFKPPAEYCPLCPSKGGGGVPTEVPYSSFDVAVFDNRFPAFELNNAFAPEDGLLKTAPARGKCEVVVYTADHGGDVGRLPQERLELLLEAWIHRYEVLRATDGIKFVMPFENRGEDAGVTLHHPHGQIYAYGFVPPVIKQAVESFRAGSVITELLEKSGSKYVVAQDQWMSVFVPPFARYPYELWISANRSLPGPWEFDVQEKESFARMLGMVVRLYDRFFEQKCPYVYVMHASPAGEEKFFEFSAQFYPLLRGKGRLKYLAGCEQGAGAFLSDVLPEDAAAQLRGVIE